MNRIAPRVQLQLPRNAPFSEAEDIVNNIWHVGVFIRLADDLEDANSILRRSGLWKASDASIFRDLANSLRNDSSRVPERFRPILDLYLRSFE